jgi:hypothetical protein
MLTNTSSSSHQACVSFAATLVQRYRASPTVFAWEIGNEHNLITDLDCSGQTWGCAPQLGTPAARTSADSSSSRDYLSFQSSIVAVIRQHDALRRPISSGHSLPRPSAHHLMQAFPRADWTADTLDQVSFHQFPACLLPHAASQFHTMLVLMAGACDWVSVHFYADDVSRFGFTGAQLLQNACVACNATGMSLYVGEFGDDKSKGAGAPVTEAVLEFLAEPKCSALARPATVWVWGESRSTHLAQHNLLQSCDCCCRIMAAKRHVCAVSRRCWCGSMAKPAYDALRSCACCCVDLLASAN